MVIVVTKPIRVQAIMNLLCTTNTKTLHVADLSCSSRRNAFLVVLEVMEMACIISQKLKKDIPEFQVYLNDLPHNNFNAIFTSLKRFQDRRGEKEVGIGLGHVLCKWCPGSFYGRPFPSKSLHFVHSSYSLMWLSQEIFSKNLSGLWDWFGCRPGGLEGNKGNIYRASTRPPQGKIDEQKLDSFNIPEYTPCPSEVKHVVENDRSFTINSLNLTQVPWAGAQTEKNCTMRSMAEPLLTSHFGESIIDEAFKRFRENLSNCYTREAPNYYNVTVSLPKK